MKNNLTKTQRVIAADAAGVSVSRSRMFNSTGVSGFRFCVMSLLFVLVATFAFIGSAQAQDNLHCSCNDFRIPLNADGEANVTPAMVATNESQGQSAPTCELDSLFVRLVDENDEPLQDLDGNVLTDSTLLLCNHVGETVKAELWGFPTGSTDSVMVCWSYAIAEDKRGPSCEVEDYTLSCKDYRDPYVMRRDTFWFEELVLPSTGFTSSTVNVSNVGRIRNLQLYMEGDVVPLSELRSSLSVTPTYGANAGTPATYDVIRGCSGMSDFVFNFNHQGAPFDCADLDQIIQTRNNEWDALIMTNMAGAYTLNGAASPAGSGSIDSAYLVISYDYLPIVTDNCQEIPRFSYKDVNNFPLCPDTGMIERTWTVTDPGGMTSTCSQTITIELNDQPTIVWPRDTQFSCIVDISELDANDLTGFDRPVDSVFYSKPHFYGAEDYCGNLASTYQDEIYDICLPYGYKIRRAWKIRDWCDENFDSNYVQYIKVLDLEAPQIIAPDSLVYSLPHDDCYLDLDLPEVSMTDNCDTSPRATVEFYDHFTGAYVGSEDIPAGRYDAIYTARDACGNENWDTILVIVQDLVDPVPVCDQNTNVTLTNRAGDPNGGWATIWWNTIEEGSTDNCIIDSFRISKTGLDGDFHEFLTYGCSEVGRNEVYLRVWDATGNYNTCWANVYVEDKVQPELECRTDTIFCNDDIDRQLEAIVENTPDEWWNDELIDDNCERPSLICTDFSSTGDDCNPAYERVCYVEDAYGNRSLRCTHRVDVIDDTPWRIVSFPDDVTNLSCFANTDPSNTGEPVVDYDCEHIGVRYEDAEYRLCNNSSNILKIRRTWFVTDWCTNADITHVQEIVQNDDVPPVLTVPADLTAEITSNDCMVTVPVRVSAIDDCGLPVDITNDYNNQRAEASGTMIFTFPTGQYPILFRAEDKCGNVTTEEMLITVIDAKAPTARCSDISVNIKSTGIVSLDATLLNNGSDDNCTDEQNLEYLIAKVDANGNIVGTPRSSIVYDCDDVNITHDVELSVIDAAGNVAPCRTTVTVMDNDNVCGTSGNRYAVAGYVNTSAGQPVEQAQVHIRDTENNMVETSGTGDFMFPALLGGNNYEIYVTKDQSYYDGVTTLDLIHIKRHILEVAHLDSPLKILAADADGNQKISTLDMIQIRQLILRQTSGLVNSSAWKFVDANHTFTDPLNPWLTEIPYYVMSENLSNDNMDIEFVGVKVGDVDQSLDISRQEDGIASISVEDRQVETANTYDIKFTMNDLKDVIGGQLTLAFDPTRISFLNIQKNDLVDMHFNTENAQEGLVAISWDAIESLPTDEVLFTLTIEAQVDAKLSDLLAINSSFVRSETYSRDGKVLDVSLEFESNKLSGFELYQNQPNPFSAETSIGFHIADNETVTLKVLDISGKLIYEHTGEFDAGKNEFLVSNAHLTSGGIYYYHVETSTMTATKKMIFYKN